jgi:hypothetical protein
MADWFPDEPEVPEGQRSSGHTPLRYEDVAQDGRIMLLALPHAIGDVIWRKVLVKHPISRLSHSGIIPILSRFVIEGGEGPISVRHPLDAVGRYQLSHTVGDDGQVRHLMLNMWAKMSGPIGRTQGPPPPRAGEIVPVGRVFAEHVFTRLFAPPGERKIVRLDAEGLPPVPPDVWTWRPPEATAALPPSAQPLDPELVPDEAEVVFGLNHTDSNQHVNSLVYPRLFADAALRRFAAHGHGRKVLARRMEIAYRKPCFAGDRARITLRAFSDGNRLGATGVFRPAADPSAPPYCFLHMLFE